MRLSRIAVIGLALVACEATPPLQSVRQPIVGGALASGDPAIVELLSFKGNLGARCTATLITPRLLLAAAHCIVETPGFERHIFVGNDDRNPAPKDMLTIKAVVPHPQYTRPRMGNDFCIIVLESPLAVPPIKLNRSPLESAQGKTIRYVGYGLVTVGNPQSGGIKRQNRAPLAQVSRLLLTIGPNANQVCEGDSGGPMLLDDGQGESIIGVGSFVDAPACRNNSYYQRIDTQIAWIDEQIQKYDPPGGAGPPGDAGATDSAPLAPSDAGATDVLAPSPDAAAPEKDSAPATPFPTADASMPDVSRAPDGKPASAPPPPPSADPGGCRYGGGAPPAPDPGGALAGLLLALLALSARRGRSR